MSRACIGSIPSTTFESTPCRTIVEARRFQRRASCVKLKIDFGPGSHKKQCEIVDRYLGERQAEVDAVRNFPPRRSANYVRGADAGLRREADVILLRPTNRSDGCGSCSSEVMRGSEAIQSRVKRTGFFATLAMTRTATWGEDHDLPVPPLLGGCALLLLVTPRHGASR